MLDTERFDLNGDFDTSTGKFTAPVTGKYMLTATVLFDQLSPGGQYINLDITTSNIGYEGAYVDTDTFDSTSIAHTLTVTALADMDANDTALLRSYNNTGTTTHDIDGDTRSNDCIHDRILMLINCQGERTYHKGDINGITYIQNKSNRFTTKNIIRLFI